MSEELTYKRLRDLAREEKVQPGLVALPQDFYSDISTFLSSRFTEMESSSSVMQMREFENAVAIIREISTVRQQKILFKAIRSGGAHTGTDLMTKDEHELYDRFCAVIEDARFGLETLLQQYESKKKSPNQKREADVAKAAADAQKGASVVAPASSLKKVRFLKEVPAYKGPNNETLGPFKPGEEGQLPTSEAEWLTRGKLAESLE